MDDVASQVRKHLEAISSSTRTQVTVEQVEALVNSLLTATPLAEALQTDALSGLTRQDAVDVVETLGKFIARSRKSRYRGGIVYSESVDGLFPLTKEELQARYQELRRHYNRNSSARGGRVAKASKRVLPGFSSGVVGIPPGWRSDDLGRNIAQSVATCLVSDTDRQLLERFVARTYAPRNTQLTADHVLLLAWLDRHGLLAKLSELQPAHSDLAAAFTQAWDLLETYSLDAGRALTELREQSTLDTVNLAAVRKSAARALWTRPGEVSRVLDSVPTDDSGNTRIVSARLRSLASLLADNPTWASPQFPGGLDEGQVQQICRVAGLVIDDQEESRVVRHIRQQLVDMGLSSDLDREVAEGLRAWRSGLLEEFFTNRADRISGDTQWAVRWQETLATV